MKNKIIISGLSAMTSFLLSAQSQQPNIVLFLVDDMGWQDTSVPFWEQETPFNRMFHTPNMKRLVKQGVKFTSAYACLSRNFCCLCEAPLSIPDQKTPFLVVPDL